MVRPIWISLNNEDEEIINCSGLHKQNIFFYMKNVKFVLKEDKYSNIKLVSQNLLKNFTFKIGDPGAVPFETLLIVAGTPLNKRGVAKKYLSLPTSNPVVTIFSGS